MQSLTDSIESKFKKPQVVDVKSGDIVRVYQKIQEGDKTRIQMFEGLVIRTSQKNRLVSTILVRRIASGVGVEKSFLLHSPLIQKVEVVKRSQVRRNYLSYMRERSGKSARLAGTEFDKEAVNSIEEQQAQAEVVPGEPEDEKAEAEPETKIEAPKDETPEADKEEAKKEPPKEAKTEEKPEAAKDDSKAKPSTDDSAAVESKK